MEAPPKACMNYLGIAAAKESLPPVLKVPFVYESTAKTNIRKYLSKIKRSKQMKFR